MDWVVAVSPGDCAGGELSPETESAALAAFHEHGCVLLRGALPLPLIEAMHHDYLAQFGAMGGAEMRAEAAKPPPNRLLGVGNARYDITLRMTGAFGSPEVFANGLLLKLLRPLLGRGMHLSNFTTVVSHPGAPQQHAHRDCSHLFDEAGVGPGLPVYAVNVAVPLIDVDLETGPTAVWLGSHRFAQNAAVKDSDMAQCSLQRGDCLMLDYRTLHAGLANRGQKTRPIVYMVYARAWFFDDVNHVKRIPLDMPLEDYERLPDSVRPLLIRAFSHAVRQRWPELDAPVSRPSFAERKAPPSFAPAPAGGAPPIGKVGRNDPCPCGSGKKYKQCHGAFTSAASP
ncbi:MAG TPA: phytanoyl-CoA dioxygenase family protein [Xanthobacteraceae bacterium]